MQTKLLVFSAVLSSFLIVAGCSKTETATNLQPMSVALVTTATADPLTQTSAAGGGNITDDGGSDITQRGVCWNIKHNPTISNFSTNDGQGIGTFTSSLKGLVGTTTYYVRAYATNILGTSYGNEQTFRTP